MNEEIEYAEMLEIPVSTVNVAKKRRKNKNNKFFHFYHRKPSYIYFNIFL